MKKMGDLCCRHNRVAICFLCLVIIIAMSLVYMTGKIGIGNLVLPVSVHLNVIESVTNSLHTERSRTFQKTTATIDRVDHTSLDIIVAPDLSYMDDDTLLVFILSHPDDLEVRNKIRRSWANSNYYKKSSGKWTLATIFVIATLCRPEERRDCKMGSMEIVIAREVPIHGDILLLNMRDTYDNLVRKVRLSLDWILLHSRARYILKVDSDVMLNTFAWIRVVEDLLSKNASCLIVGIPLVDTPVLRFGKFAIPDEEYELERYPNYLGGASYLMSRDAVDVILHMTSQKRYFKMEDIYFTGMAVKNTQIHQLGIPTTANLPLFTIPDDFNDVLKSLEGALVAQNIPGNQWWNMWNMLLSHNNGTHGHVTFRLTDITETNARLPKQWIFSNETNNMCTYKNFDLDSIG